MFRREWALTAGGYRELCTNWEDFDFFVRMARLGPVYVIAKPLYAYRFHPTTTTAIRALAAVDRMYQCIDRLRGGEDYARQVADCRPVAASSYSGWRMRVNPGFAAVAAALLAIGHGSMSAWQGAPGLAVTVEARSIQPGELALLTVVTPDATDVMAAHAFGRRVATYRVDRTRWRTLVGIDLSTPPGRYPVTFDSTVDGRRLATTSTLDVRDKAFPTRELSVADAFVNPPASEAARIAAEGARLDAIWKVETPQRLWDSPFVRPVVEPANSAFGSRSVFNGQMRTPHSGADFLSPAGTPVHAPAGGRVVLAAPLYYSGNTVVIDHGLGLYSLFAHFSAIAVHEGDLVTAGDVLGRVGATGRVTGPHLHWAVRVGGARVDPLSVLAMLGVDPKGG